MKRNTYILALLALACMAFASCKKFLEKEPIGKTGKITLFETVEGAQKAMNGAYNSMLSYYKTSFALYADVASDNVIRGTRASALLPQFNFQSVPSDDALAVGDIWLNIYSTINNVNNIIDAVPTLKSKFPNQVQTLDLIYAQSLALRALCHFDLSRAYAQPYNYTPDASHLGIPVILKTPSPGNPVTRKTMKETYEQITADLGVALPLLQQYANHTTQATMSYQAALALLSRIYLYKGDWEQSITFANMVINDANYKLATATEYLSVFNTYPADDASPKLEAIFQLTNKGFTPGTGNIYTVYSDAVGAQYSTATKLTNFFDSDDIRLTKMFTIPISGDNAGKSLTKKYGDGSVSANTSQVIQVIRLSELYLNRAEAKWQLQRYAEAAEDLRIISQRAHPNRTISITYSSNDDLYKQIANERNRELCFENHRLFDLARRKENLQRGADCNANVCSFTYPNKNYVLPISAKEIEANRSIIQNPGY